VSVPLRERSPVDLVGIVAVEMSALGIDGPDEVLRATPWQPSQKFLTVGRKKGNSVLSYLFTQVRHDCPPAEGREWYFNRGMA
jgi:hypothetical protein